MPPGRVAGESPGRILLKMPAMTLRPVTSRTALRLGDAEARRPRGVPSGAALDDALAGQLDRLRDVQERLFADARHALLIVLQGRDASGKDGTIEHVFSGVNPQGCEVTAFRAPTSEDLHHDFLWRIHHRTPARGMIGIFNRSHYEDVIV